MSTTFSSPRGKLADTMFLGNVSTPHKIPFAKLSACRSCKTLRQKGEPCAVAGCTSAVMRPKPKRSVTRPISVAKQHGFHALSVSVNR